MPRTDLASTPPPPGSRAPALPELDDFPQYGGYRTRLEPVSGLPFLSFTGTSESIEGEAPRGFAATAEEALRLHVEALVSWVQAWCGKVRRPVILWRVLCEVEQRDLGWIASSRVLVTSGGRDTRRDLVPIRVDQQPSSPISIRAVVVPSSGDPVIGLVQAC